MVRKNCFSMGIMINIVFSQGRPGEEEAIFKAIEWPGRATAFETFNSDRIRILM